MSQSPNRFMWYELMTTDTQAAAAFYSAVVGWQTADAGMPGGSYTLFTLDGDGNCGGNQNGVAGLMKIPEGVCQSGGRPGWVGYIAVDDTDATIERIRQVGGALQHGPIDIPGVGRFAAVSDPHGAVFMLITPQGEAPVDTPSSTAPGRCGWHELHAGNGPEAFEFYSNLFGWQKADAMDMGDHGVYQLFNAGAEPIGAVMTKMPDMPAPLWNYYFNVDNIDTAVTRIKANGGQILMGPHEVPGGMWIVQGCDPQGAMFALVAPSAHDSIQN